MRWRGRLPQREVAGRFCVGCSDWGAPLPLERLCGATRSPRVGGMVGRQQLRVLVRNVAASNS